MTVVNSKSSGQVQRQRSLPWSKAVEIAYKSIRLRLSRSLLVTSGIVLALAFLMSILAGEAMTQGMRDWIATAPTSATFDALRTERADLETKRQPLTDQLFRAARSPEPVPAGAPEFDAKAAFGDELPDIAKALGTPLPAGAEE